MVFKSIVSAACTCLVVVSFNANAALITINPADYAIGTNLDNAYPGISFSYQSDWSPDSTVVSNSITNKIVSTPNGARTVFSDTSGNAFFNSTHALRIDSSIPINWVSVELIPDANSTTGTLISFAANGSGLQGSPGSYPVIDTLPFYAGPLITDYPGPEEPMAIIVTGIEGGGYIGNIKINIVPIPASIWLFGSGLLGLIGLARRKV